MGFEPLVWYCQPEENGIWAKKTASALGAYTPCGIESVVGCISNVVLMGSCVYRLWLIIKDYKVQRFCLRSKYYNYMLTVLAGYCAAESLFRLLFDVSMFNFHAQSSLAPFEVVSLMIETLVWSSLVIMNLLETKVYIREFRWYVRFGILYVLIGDVVKLSVILAVKEFYPSYILYVYISSLICQALFGVLLFAYVPNLDAYLGHIPLQTEPHDNIKYEVLPGGENICPERHANILSRIYFGWMTPLMQQGYRKPITEKDVWMLDTWDRSEILSRKFQKCWAEESQKSNPYLLRCLNNCVGGRFWFGGLFKVMISFFYLDVLMWQNDGSDGLGKRVKLSS